YGSDDTGGDGGHHVVAVDLAPLIAAGRGAEVIGAVVDALTAAPVFGAHVVALLPLFVANILLVVVVVVVVMLGERHERGTADTEKDERRYGLFEQGLTSRELRRRYRETMLPVHAGVFW